MTCSIPEQKDHGAIDYDWKPDKKREKKRKDEDGGETIEPFLDFGGERFRKLAAARNQRAGSTPSRPNAMTPSTSTTAFEAAEAAKKNAEAEAVRAEAAAKKKRREALKSTLGERRAKNHARRKTSSDDGA